MKRKRLILFALVAVTCFCSCHKELEYVTPDGYDETQYPVRFSSYMERTKGETAANPLGDGVAFNMYADYNSASGTSRFYSCVKYVWDGEYFISTPVYYWPANGSLDFYAVAPASGNFLPGKIVDVTISDGKADLLTAKELGKTRHNPVTLNFGHKLTKLSFKAVGGDTRLRYQIDAIKVKTASVAKFDLASNSWTQAATDKEYSYMSAASKTIAANTSSAVDVEGVLMLLPVQTKVLLEVSYKAYDGETCVHDGTHEIDLTDSAVPSTSATRWDINRHICYTLKLSPGDCIIFNASREEWDSVSSAVDVNSDN